MLLLDSWEDYAEENGVAKDAEKEPQADGYVGGRYWIVNNYCSMIFFLLQDGNGFFFI